MTTAALARELFASPGALPAQTRHLLAQAAGAHARLLATSAAAHERPLDELREAVGGYLRGSAPAFEKRLVLDDPLFVEALHALSGASDDLNRWDAAVAPGCGLAADVDHRALARGRLGNVVAGIVLRRRRGWCGAIELASDAYGRVHLPFCDWAMVLVDEGPRGRELWAHRALVLELDAQRAAWRTAEAAEPLVEMPRATFDVMFVDNRDVPESAPIQFGTRPPRPRFERAAAVGRTRIRFEPIGGEAPDAHAETSGAIVSALVAAIERNAPAIHGQLCQCIRTIHGFELPPYGCGQIASFSVPTSPGVIGFNVPYTDRGEPQLSPFCFLWLGHELGHTLHYLIDDVAYTHGWQFLENPGETTPCVPRYGRSLRVRTLFSIPYVHLFEWWLLIEFLEHGFAALPWQVPNDAIDVGEDLRAEIREAFEWIDAHARLTPAGRAVVHRLRELAAEAESRWRAAVGRRPLVAQALA